MKLFRKKYKELAKYYEKELASINSLNLKIDGNCADYLYLQLRYKRDRRILTAPRSVNLSKDLEFVALCVAVTEYESYYNCVLHYYSLADDGLPQPLDEKADANEVAAKYANERTAH